MYTRNLAYISFYVFVLYLVK